MKKAIYIISVLIICLLLTSCGENSLPVADKDGEKINYAGDELNINSLESAEGIFVKNKDGSFSPLIANFFGYSYSMESSPNRFLWLTENAEGIMKLIPKVSKADQLVMMYNKDENIPEDFFLEKYNYKGYSVGCHFYRDVDNTMYILTNDTLPGTYIEASLETINDEESYTILEINDSEKLPASNVDNNMQILLGLDKGKYYKFSFYKGTKYMSITTIADTQVFQSDKIIELNTNSYKETKDGYFIINLPDNLEKGYYYVCGLGMFYFEE